MNLLRILFSTVLLAKYSILFTASQILTAGHCVTESWLIRWLNIDAVAGAHDVDRFNDDVQISTIVQRIEHHNYMGGIGPNDIAVLKTERPFIFTNEVQPIPLPRENVDLSSGSLVLAGWGALDTTGYIPQLPSLLQELSVTYVPYDLCYSQLNDFLEKSDDVNPLNAESNICTGPLEGGKAACVGDSGGPLVLVVKNKNTHRNNKTEDVDDYEDDYFLENKVYTNDTDATPANTGEEEFLVGVVSWGVSPCGEKGAPTVYTDVSKYLDFIKSYVNT